MRTNRLIKKVEEEGGDVSKIPLPKAEPDNDMVECQYCYR